MAEMGLYDIARHISNKTTLITRVEEPPLLTLYCEADNLIQTSTQIAG